MGYRIGEALVKDGFISEAQLSTSLTYQNQHGGRLGSNLVQLGYISEDRLAEALEKMSLYPCADKNDLYHIPSSVTALVSASFARKYDLIPFKKIGDLLSVAMVTPQNQQLISEINALTGCRVKAYVAPEIMIRRALDACYAEEAAAVVRQPSVADTEVLGTADEEIRYLSGSAESLAVSAASIGHAFEGAENATAVANLIMGYLKEYFSRIVLLNVEGSSAAGWKASGLGESTVHAFKLRMPLDKPSLFQQVNDKLTPFCGKPSELSAEDRRFLTEIGGVMPQEVFIYPVTGGVRAVLLVYADNLNKPLGESVVAAKKIMEKASLALRMLSLKAKLLAD
ncbi:MAG: hypothetical protein OEV28_03845 [Nitrospirota bacterium]|nr:hypothetical protein [Nitrospirota bacterium]